MNEEERDLLKRIAKQVEKNNDILRGMRSAHRWSSFFKFIYWAVIIISGLVLWQFIQPILDDLSKAMDSISQAKDSLGNSVNGVTNSLSDLQNLLGKIKK